MKTSHILLLLTTMIKDVASDQCENVIYLGGVVSRRDCYDAMSGNAACSTISYQIISPIHTLAIVRLDSLGQIVKLSSIIALT